MFTLFFKNTLLLSSGTQGTLWFLLLFLVCFIGVHLAKLLRLGWTYSQPKQPQNENIHREIENKEEKKAPAKSQEPVYYIIERKRKKPKTTYSEPRQITFK